MRPCKHTDWKCLEMWKMRILVIHRTEEIGHTSVWQREEVLEAANYEGGRGGRREEERKGGGREGGIAGGRLGMRPEEEVR